jgi:hypothetical protein
MIGLNLGGVTGPKRPARQGFGIRRPARNKIHPRDGGQWMPNIAMLLIQPPECGIVE